MNKYLKLHLIGFFVISILGTILHFIYDLTGNVYIIGLFSPVNESVAEHLKMIITPVVIYLSIEHIYIKEDKLIIAKVISMLFGITTIIVLFYSYTLFTNDSIVIVDCLIYYLAVAITQYISYKLINANLNYTLNKHGNILMICIIFCMFFFTFYPPNYDIFKDGNSNTYGILKLKEIK